MDIDKIYRYCDLERTLLELEKDDRDNLILKIENILNSKKHENEYDKKIKELIKDYFGGN